MKIPEFPKPENLMMIKRNCKFKFGVQDSKRCVSPLPRPLAVVKWYRIDAYWYKPDPPALGSGKQNPT